MSESPQQMFDRISEKLESDGLSSVRRIEADQPMIDKADARAKQWQIHLAKLAQNILSDAGIEYPTCPVCGKKLKANVRGVTVSCDNVYPAEIGQTVKGDFGAAFKFIGAIKFERYRMMGKPPGSIIAHCPDGTFGRWDHFPFCTARCGLKFAQSSHKAGYRMKGKP